MGKVCLGDKCKDKISGFSGIATGRAEWLNGCVRINIASNKLKDGKPFDAWFDEMQIAVIGKSNLSKASRITGGPRKSPRRSGDPASF